MKTIITIEIETEFNPMLDEDKQDLKEKYEKEFHESIFNMVEGLIQDDEFEEKWQEEVDDNDEYEYIPAEELDLSDYGKISIKIQKH